MFIPRHPVVENQFCSYGAQTDTGSAGVGGVVAYAGSVVALYPTATNQEPVVYKMVHGGTVQPFGFLMQKVKTGYHQVHPTGYFMPGDFGSSDVLAQPDYNTAGAIIGTKAVPVGVAHLGIWDTVHYTSDGGAAAATALTPGQALYPAADSAKVTNSTTNSDGTDTAGERTLLSGGAPPQVAVVVKGASAAKASANINNTTLYPIRIKLLV
jgi:hypothetical protein